MEDSVNSRYIRKRTIAHRRVKDQTVVVSPRTGEVLVLNETGGMVWQLTDGTRDVQGVATHIAETFGADFSAVLTDVKTLYADLLDAGTIELVE